MNATENAPKVLPLNRQWTGRLCSQCRSPVFAIDVARLIALPCAHLLDTHVVIPSAKPTTSEGDPA